MIQPRKPSLRISIVFFIVIRRLKLAAVLLCLPVLISCSTKPEQIAQEQLPSLGIKGGQEYKFSQGEVQVFRLIPQGEPSGEISLKAVQNGQVKQLNRFQFMHMWNDGGLAVKLTDTIELAFNVKCQSTAFGSGINPLPAKETCLGEGCGDWNGKQGDAEHIFWSQIYQTGERPSRLSIGSSIEDFVSLTRKQPTLKVYVLTVKLDGE